MAKHSDEPKPQQPPQPLDPRRPPEKTDEPKEKPTHTVTFAGQAPVSVTAGSDEEAVKKAAEQLGVVSSEKPPEVVKAEQKRE